MIFINLLPPDKKIVVKRDLIFTLLISTLEFFVILAVLTSSVLVAGKTVLENNFNNAVGQNALINKNFGLINRDIRQYNDQFTDTENLFNQSLNWSHFLLDIGELVSTAVSLRNLSLNPETKKIIIVGFASQRNDLIDLLERLKKNDNLLRVESPISNLFSRTNIVFEITADLNMRSVQKNYSLP